MGAFTKFLTFLRVTLKVTSFQKSFLTSSWYHRRWYLWVDPSRPLPVHHATGNLTVFPTDQELSAGRGCFPYLSHSNNCPHPQINRMGAQKQK